MNQSSAELFYDGFAPIYDQTAINAWGAPFQVEHVISEISNASTNILDIGIGTGLCIRKIYENSLFKEIEGIDTSTKMLEICREKYPKILLHHGDFIVYKNFRQAEYELIICCGALELIPDLNAFFEKCSLLLSQNGCLVLTYEPQIDNHRIQAQNISQIESDKTQNVENFTAYRYSLDYFRSVVTDKGFKIVKEQLFVAFRQFNSDIIYSVVKLVRQH